MGGNVEGEGPRPLARLEITRGPGTGEILELSSPVVRVGRAPQNDLVLDDDSVSSKHARLEFSEGAWRVIDLDSTNGTYVDDVRLAPEVLTPIPPGSLVAFGGVRLEFRPDEEADPAAARDSWTPAAEVAEEPTASGFRLPVWLLALIVIVLAIAVFLFFWFSAPVPQAEPTAPAVSLLMAAQGP
jgi:hypothetical protein